MDWYPDWNCAGDCCRSGGLCGVGAGTVPGGSSAAGAGREKIRIQRQFFVPLISIKKKLDSEKLESGLVYNSQSLKKKKRKRRQQKKRKPRLKNQRKREKKFRKSKRSKRCHQGKKGQKNAFHFRGYRV